MNIKLEDKGSNASSWQFVDKETILAERQAKLDAAQAKADKKAAIEAAKVLKLSTPAEMYFKTFHAEEYEAYDEQGIPTHSSKADKKGTKEINANIRNKLVK